MEPTRILSMQIHFQDLTTMPAKSVISFDQFGLSEERALDLRRRLKAAKNVVVFTGAGASAESGVPTFRDAQVGLWKKFDAEELASPEGFKMDPSLVWGWYEWRRATVCRAMPNPGHSAIAQWAKSATISVVTQNVDDLHERAGSTGVIHLHGSLFLPRCIVCGSPFKLGPPTAAAAAGIRIRPPKCLKCSKFVRPGVVWFGESLPQGAFHKAERLAAAADVLVCVGTSGVVYPAAGIPSVARAGGATVVTVNLERSAKLRGTNDFSIQGAAGDVLPMLVEAATGESAP